MRAICGAIITAGALIGLGLTALGYGIRFQAFIGPQGIDGETHQLYGIPSMAVILVVLLIALVVGMGIAFLGLAFHHERRHRERLRELAGHTPPHGGVAH